MRYRSSGLWGLRDWSGASNKLIHGTAVISWYRYRLESTRYAMCNNMRESRQRRVAQKNSTRLKRKPAILALAYRIHTELNRLQPSVHECKYTVERICNAAESKIILPHSWPWPPTYIQDKTSNARPTELEYLSPAKRSVSRTVRQSLVASLALALLAVALLLHVCEGAGHRWCMRSACGVPAA